MKKITLQVYTDPMHGWIKISLKHLNQLNLIDKITSYSYINNKHAYLEEDVDASLLIKTLKENNVNYQFRYNHAYGKSSLRYYNSYNIDQAMKGIQS